MMLIKTKLRPSPIEGLGLFADQDVKKGDPIWKFMPGFDQVLSPEELAKAPSSVRDFCERYAYLHTRTGNYVLCGDDARFMNHSDSPNTGGTYVGVDDEGMDIALRDIARGEELTCDYRDFDGEFELKMSLAEPAE